MNILLFGGTTEGRELAQWCASNKIKTTVCVATEYGKTLLPSEVDCRVGRLDIPEMTALIKGHPEGFTHIIDGTHPYATVVTKNIKESTSLCKLPYLRLLRDQTKAEGDWISVGSIGDASKVCETLSGNILLTTGSKELSPFAVDGLKERSFPRVLPMISSLSQCLDLGFPLGQIIALQGPCGKELNIALIHQYDIKILVTKASGGVSGFWEKVEASKECGLSLIVIEPPLQVEGYSMDEIQKKLELGGQT